MKTDLLPNEIRPGLVLHLDLGSTDDYELAIDTSGVDVRAIGPHFFWCSDVVQDRSLWWPLTTHPGPDRFLVPYDRRTGHEKVVGGTFHWHRVTAFVLTFDQLRLTADGDNSRPGYRNRIGVWPDAPGRRLTDLTYNLRRVP